MNELKQISIKGILADLDNSLSRKEIGEKYELSTAEVKAMFEHPKLKGKKAKKKFVASFQLVDDVEIMETDKAVDIDEPNESPVRVVEVAEAMPTVTDEEQKEVAGLSFDTPDFE